MGNGSTFVGREVVMGQGEPLPNIGAERAETPCAGAGATLEHFKPRILRCEIKEIEFQKSVGLESNGVRASVPPATAETTEKKFLVAIARCVIHD
jgi:hypothetical protein